MAKKILITILLISAIFRLYRIGDYMEFLGDQGRDVVIIRNFLTTGRPFFIGPQTSIGNMYLGPFYYYLIAPSLLLANFNPIGPSVFIALLGVLTTFLIYYVTRKWFSLTTGLLAAFLYAISPVAIKYNNFSWNPNVMPLFALVFVYFLATALREKKYTYLSYAALAFIMALNSHYLALALLPLAGILLVHHLYTLKPLSFSKTKYFFRNCTFALLLFILSFTPQILFDIKHQGQNSKAILTFFTHRETTVNIKAYKAIPNLVPLFNQVNTRLLGGKNQDFGLIVTVFISLILAFIIIRYRQTANYYLVVISLWYFTGLVGLGLYKQHIYDHYFGFLFPVVFILAAYLIVYLGRLSIFTKVLSVTFVISLIIFSLIENPFRYSPPRQLDQTQKVVQSIEGKASGEPFNLALLAKQNYDPPYRYFLNLHQAPLFDLHDKNTDQLFVICEPHPDINCQPINNPEWSIAAFGWAKIDQEWQIDSTRLYRLVHNPDGAPQAKN